MSGKKVVIFGWAHRVHTRRWVTGMAGRGFNIKLISLGGEQLPGIETVNFPYGGKAAYLKYLSRAVAEARRFQPDLVHAHYAAGFGLWGMQVKIRPTLVSVWGADVIDFPSNIITRGLIRRILKKADGITATSHFLKQAVEKLLPEAGKKTTVIPFGVKIPAETPPFPANRPIKICFIKAHREKYGPDILLKAMARVVEKIPDIQLSMAGEGEMTPKLKELTASLNLSNNVTFTGFIANEKIYDFIRRHHFMVMPSVMASESFGVAVLEAGACARPAAASRVGGVSEVIVDGQTGLLLPAGDIDQLAAAIVKLAENLEKTAALGRKAYEFAKENYTWEKSLDLMVSVYERMIHGG
ncbi:MAG: glycosyltransferase [Candidatus Zixiibacteriota bacterium]